MSLTEEISIKVPVDVAQAYRNATEVERQNLSQRIVLILRYLGWADPVSNLTRQEALNNLWQIMDDISEKAAEKGLTPEILESILAGDV